MHCHKSSHFHIYFYFYCFLLLVCFALFSFVFVFLMPPRLFLGLNACNEAFSIIFSSMCHNLTPPISTFSFSFFLSLSCIGQSKIGLGREDRGKAKERHLQIYFNACEPCLLQVESWGSNPNPDVIFALVYVALTWVHHSPTPISIVFKTLTYLLHAISCC